MRAIVDVSTGKVTVDENYTPPQPVLTKDDVDTERDRRIVEGSVFSVTGYANTIRLSGNEKTQKFLSQRGTGAAIKILSGQASYTYQWRDEDDIVHTLTAEQMSALAEAGIKYVEAVIMASWAIKDDPAGLPDDIAGDARWPA